MCSDKFLQSYRKPFITVLNQIIQNWIPRYEDYCVQQIYDEVQNQLEYLVQSD